MLTQAAYPDVLVAYAVTDGQALELVLMPGNGPCCSRIEICRMVPGRSYRVVGAVQQQITAEAGGSAWLDVDLNARARILITPLS